MTFTGFYWFLLVLDTEADLRAMVQNWTEVHCTLCRSNDFMWELFCQRCLASEVR